MMWETGVSLQTVNIPLRWFIYITQWALTYSAHRLLNSLGSLAEARLCADMIQPFTAPICLIHVKIV